MIIVLLREATDEQVRTVVNTVREWGFRAHVVRGSDRTMVSVTGDEAAIGLKPIGVLPGVESVMPVSKPFSLASKEFHPENTLIRLPPPRRGAPSTIIGGKRIVIVAGPCSVEGRDLMIETAIRLRKAGARILRAGAFKPRTSPYAFQGLGVEGLRILKECREAAGISVVTEVLDTRDAEMVAEIADVIQIGARNMQNFSLLKTVGRMGKPVLLKRGLACTVEDLLMSAEYILSQGNEQVILCERGIRTFEKATRNTLDLNAVPVIRSLSHLPIAVDPSHGTGYSSLVTPMALASVAAGADLLMVEVHPDPRKAVSDGAQTLNFAQFDGMLEGAGKVARAVGRIL
jgi:3-deoxy-7-phosphoheptulonate synthase